MWSKWKVTKLPLQLLMKEGRKKMRNDSMNKCRINVFEIKFFLRNKLN